MSTLIFLDRSRRADDYPWLLWKVRLFVIGAGLAVGGMVMDLDWLILIAIVFLLGGFLVRFLPGGTGVVEDEEMDTGSEGPSRME